MGVLSDPDEIASYLTVGQASIIQIKRFSGPDARMKSTIIRWSAKEYVIVEVPHLTRQVDSDVTCQIRFLSRGTICGFKAVVQKMSSETGLIRFGWPSELHFSKLRAHERMGMNVKCTLKFSGGAWDDSSVRDISVGGCRIVVNGELDVGVGFELSIDPAEASDVSGVACVVRSSRAHAGGTVLGCEFEDLSAEKSQLIEDLITRIQVESRELAGLDGAT